MALLAMQGGCAFNEESNNVDLCTGKFQRIINVDNLSLEDCSNGLKNISIRGDHRYGPHMSSTEIHSCLSKKALRSGEGKLCKAGNFSWGIQPCTTHALVCVTLLSRIWSRCQCEFVWVFLVLVVHVVSGGSFEP